MEQVEYIIDNNWDLNLKCIVDFQNFSYNNRAYCHTKKLIFSFCTMDMSIYNLNRFKSMLNSLFTI